MNTHTFERTYMNTHTYTLSHTHTYSQAVSNANRSGWTGLSPQRPTPRGSLHKQTHTRRHPHTHADTPFHSIKDRPEPPLYTLCPHTRTHTHTHAFANNSKSSRSPPLHALCHTHTHTHTQPHAHTHTHTLIYISPCAPRAAVGLPKNNAPHVLYSSAVGFRPTRLCVGASRVCQEHALGANGRTGISRIGPSNRFLMIINGAEPVPGAVCSTRRSQTPVKQRTPRAARQCSWIPDQHSCAWERAVCAGSMPPAHTAGRGSVGSALATDSPRVSSQTYTHTQTPTHTRSRTFSIN